MSGSVRFSPAELAVLLGLHPPTTEQTDVIGAPLEPGVVVAGAGSGKTETMSARVVWLVANGFVRPEQILGLTFTRKAAGELAHRIRRRLSQLRERGVLGAEQGADLLAGEPTVSTYNSYASRILSEHALRLGVEPSSRLLREAATWQYADRIQAGYDGVMDHVEAAPSTVTAAVLALAGEMAEHLVTPAQLRAFTMRLCAEIDAKPDAKSKSGVYTDVAKALAVQQARLELLPLLEAYQQLKRDNEVLDFSDQMALAAQVAIEHAEVGRAERGRFAVVLLDEYQDTGHAQRELLSHLFGGGHPVVAVGDPCQSIYGWRGASAGNLARFPEHFPLRSGAPSPVRTLTVSFRNDERILTVANALSTPLRESGYPVPELTSGPGGLGSGAVECSLHLSIVAEADAVAERLAQVWRDGPQGTGGEGAPVTAAVLVRKRSQIPLIAEALRVAGLPVEVVGVGGLLATPEVADVVATLRVLIDPSAGASLMRLLTGPRWRIGPRDLDALGNWAYRLAGHRRGLPAGEAAPAASEDVDERSIIDALDELQRAPRSAFSETGYERMRALARELAALRARSGQSLADLVADIERVSGLDVEVATREGALQTSQTLARAHLDRFGDVAAEFEASAGGDGTNVRAFLSYLDAADARERGLTAGEVDVSADAIQILTVHGAKGLEWDVVVVPGLCEGVFPGTPSGGGWLVGIDKVPYPLRGDARDMPAWDISQAEDQKGVNEARKAFRDRCKERDLAEERRLVYVATTRARHLLICTGYRWDHTVKPRAAARFLTEISEVSTAVGAWVDHVDEEAGNPLLAEPVVEQWPRDSLGARRAVVEAAASLVRRAGASVQSGEEFSEWDHEVTLLLAERAARRRVAGAEVVLPENLSVSRLVALRSDPDALARELRRPMPRKPAPLARRGTSFHAWLESEFGTPQLLDLDELPGSGDDDAAPDADLELLRNQFRASEWGARQPLDVEVPFEMVIGEIAIRGRMDAVFAGGDGRFDVVDWKTGKQPTGEAAEAAAVQLAAYRLAWAALAGVPVEQVGAAFHYVRSNTTVRPADLLDADGLAALVRGVPVASD